MHDDGTKPAVWTSRNTTISFVEPTRCQDVTLWQQGTHSWSAWWGRGWTVEWHPGFYTTRTLRWSRRYTFAPDQWHFGWGFRLLDSVFVHTMQDGDEFTMSYEARAWRPLVSLGVLTVLGPEWEGMP